MNAPPRTGAGDEHGFALLFMMILIGAAGGVFLLAVESFLVVGSDRRGRAAKALAAMRRQADDLFVRTGTMPATIGAFAAATGQDPAGAWRVDPYGRHSGATPDDYGWTLGATALTIRARGEDRRLGTADDLVVSVPTQEPGRVSTRNRLRLLRAQFLASPYRALGMSATDRANLVTWSRQHAEALRRWGLEPANQTALAATMATTEAQISGLCAARGCPPMPGSVTGVGGLMTGIGNADGRAFDGFQRALRLNPAVGLESMGADGADGSPGDDM